MTIREITNSAIKTLNAVHDLNLSGKPERIATIPETIAKFAAELAAYNENLTITATTEESFVESVKEVVISEFNRICKREVYAEIIKSEDPALAAIKTLTYPKYSLMQEKDSELYRLRGTAATLDLFDVAKACDGRFGTTNAWEARVRKLYLQVTAAELLRHDNGELAQKYLADIRMPRNLYKAEGELKAIPTSKKSITETIKGDDKSASLQELFTSAEFVRNLDTRDTGALGVWCCGHGNGAQSTKVCTLKKFGEYVLEMLNATYYGAIYTVQYKAKKDDAARNEFALDTTGYEF